MHSDNSAELNIVFLISQPKHNVACADPESFVKGGPTLIRFF